MDFLNKYEAVVYCASGVLALGSNELHCRTYVSGLSGRLVVCGEAVLKPRHVSLVAVEPIVWGQEVAGASACIVEPLHAVCLQQGILVPRGVLVPCGKPTVIQVMNPGDQL